MNIFKIAIYQEFLYSMLQIRDAYDRYVKQERQNALLSKMRFVFALATGDHVERYGVIDYLLPHPYITEIARHLNSRHNITSKLFDVASFKEKPVLAPLAWIAVGLLAVGAVLRGAFIFAKVVLGAVATAIAAPFITIQHGLKALSNKFYAWRQRRRTAIILAQGHIQRELPRQGQVVPREALIDVPRLRNLFASHNSLINCSLVSHDDHYYLRLHKGGELYFMDLMSARNAHALYHILKLNIFTMRDQLIANGQYPQVMRIVTEYSDSINRMQQLLARNVILTRPDAGAIPQEQPISEELQLPIGLNQMVGMQFWQHHGATDPQDDYEYCLELSEPLRLG